MARRHPGACGEDCPRCESLAEARADGSDLTREDWDHEADFMGDRYERMQYGE